MQSLPAASSAECSATPASSPSSSNAVAAPFTSTTPTTTTTTNTTTETAGAVADVVSSSSAPPAAGQRTRCAITATQWDTVAVWSWDVQTKVCAICKGNLADQCISCQAHVSQPASSAPPPARGGSAAGTVMSGSRGSAAAHAEVNSSGGQAGVSAGSTHRGGVGEATTGTRRTTPAPPSASAVAHKHATPATLSDLNDRCCVAWGSCGHVFHYHCVSRWLQMRTMCPVCGQQWQLHKITLND